MQLDVFCKKRHNVRVESLPVRVLEMIPSDYQYLKVGLQIIGDPLLALLARESLNDRERLWIFHILHNKPSNLVSAARLRFEECAYQAKVSLSLLYT